MTYQREYISTSPQMTADFGHCIGVHAVDGLVVALEGDLGAGKTKLAQGIAKGMGIQGIVASPTFTLLNEYDEEGHLGLHHFDWYRLDRVEELENIGFYEYGREGVTLIEWANLFADEVPRHAIRIRLETAAGGRERKLAVTVPMPQVSWWKGVEADVAGVGYIGANLDGSTDRR